MQGLQGLLCLAGHCRGCSASLWWSHSSQPQGRSTQSPVKPQVGSRALLLLLLRLACPGQHVLHGQAQALHTAAFCRAADHDRLRWQALALLLQAQAAKSAAGVGTSVGKGQATTATSVQPVWLPRYCLSVTAFVQAAGRSDEKLQARWTVLQRRPLPPLL